TLCRASGPAYRRGRVGVAEEQGPGKRLLCLRAGLRWLSPEGHPSSSGRCASPAPAILLCRPDRRPTAVETTALSGSLCGQLPRRRAGAKRGAIPRHLAPFACHWGPPAHHAVTPLCTRVRRCRSRTDLREGRRGGLPGLTQNPGHLVDDEAGRQTEARR